MLAHESFENEAIAKIMNDSFVNIKLDREERPDIDRIYMTYLQVSAEWLDLPVTTIADFRQRKEEEDGRCLFVSLRFGHASMMQPNAPSADISPDPESRTVLCRDILPSREVQDFTTAYQRALGSRSPAVRGVGEEHDREFKGSLWGMSFARKLQA